MKKALYLRTTGTIKRDPTSFGNQFYIEVNGDEDNFELTGYENADVEIDIVIPAGTEPK